MKKSRAGRQWTEAVGRSDEGGLGKKRPMAEMYSVNSKFLRVQAKHRLEM